MDKKNGGCILKMGIAAVLYKKEFKKAYAELEMAWGIKNYEKTIAYLKFLSSIFYEINYKLTDERLEDLTKGLAQLLIKEVKVYPESDKTILFYDGFGLKNRGLAGIYIKALSTLGYKTFWLIYEGSEIASWKKEIIESANNIEIYVLPKQRIPERMKTLKSSIEKIKPAHIFLYTEPSDIAGIGTASVIIGSCKRYLIDLTDHAFWLGKNAADYFVEFRSYGGNVAASYRGLAINKLQLLPFYPEDRSIYKFEGLPFDVNQCPFVFSGGSLYKIAGRTYKKLVASILKENRKVYFVYAGNGTCRELKWLKRKFHDQFYSISERKDLDQIMKRASFFLNTTPIGGGLMVQYAIANQCIPLSLTSPRMPIVNPKSFVLHPERFPFVYEKPEALLEEANRILREPSYREKRKCLLLDQIITRESFEKNLDLLIKEKRTEFKIENQAVDLDEFLKIYKRRAGIWRFCQLIYRSHNKYVWRRHPIAVWLGERMKK